MANFTVQVPGYPFFMENLTNAVDGEIKYSAADFRNYTAAFHRQQGVLGPTDFQVTQADNVGFRVKIAKGSALVGGYVVTMLEDITVDLAFAQNPGTTCNNKIFLIVHDEAYDANSVGYEALIQGSESVNGAPAPEPTFNAGFIELATIVYNPGQSNVQNKDITDPATPVGGGSAPVNLVPRSGMGTFGENPIRCMINGGRAFLSGGIYRTTGAAFVGTGTAIVTTLPAGYRPRSPRFVIGAAGPYGPQNIPGMNNDPGPHMHHVQVDPDGTVTTTLPPGGNPYFLHFDGMSYDLD